MRISIDTSAYSEFERSPEILRATIEVADEVWFCPVVIGELHAGFISGSRRLANLKRLDAFLSRPGIYVGFIDSLTAECYATIATHLRQRGTPLPTNDIWIAAHALQHDLQVITLDAHFLEIPQISTRLFER